MFIRSIRPALAPITPNDHSGYLWIATILGVIYTFIVAVARLFVKFRVLGADDYVLALATFFHIAQSVPIFITLTDGVPKHINTKALLAAECIAIVALCLVKCSVTAILIRIFTKPHERRWYILWTFMAVNVLWGLGSVLGLLLDCNAAGTVAMANASRCPHQFLRWQIITGFDNATDLVGFLAPVIFVRGLKMKFRMKAKLVLAFSFRLPMIALSILHLESLPSLRHSEGARLSVTMNFVWLQIMLAWSLISATVPNLKGFMKSFDTSFGMPAAPGQGSTGRSNGYPMVKMSRSSIGSKYVGGKKSIKDRSQLDEMDRDDVPSFRPDATRQTTANFHADTGNHGMSDEHRYIHGNESQDLIITKDVYYSA